jgi:hypothetical protein
LSDDFRATHSFRRVESQIAGSGRIVGNPEVISAWHFSLEGESTEDQTRSEWRTPSQKTATRYSFRYSEFSKERSGELSD